MATQLGTTKYYQYNTNGTPSFQTMANAGNTPYGATELTQAQYIQGLQGKLSQAQNYVNSGFNRFNTPGQNFEASDVTNFQKQIADVQGGQGIYAQNYIDPAFSKYTANAPTPSSQYFTPEAQAVAAKNAASLASNTQLAANTPNQPTGVQQGGASSTTSTGASSSVTKPFGIENINSTLSSGSQSKDQVMELQKWLAATAPLGSPTKDLKADGSYGPLTIAAVKEFQANNGLQNDGVWGPLSQAKAKTFTSSGAQLGTTPVKPANDPSNQYNTDTGQPNTNYNPNANSAVGAVIESLNSQGLQINPNLTLTPDEISKILAAAQTSIHPYYQDQIKAFQQDIARQGPQLEQTYQNKIKETTSGFQQDLGTARENNAGAGTAFSGARTKGEFSMQDTTNRSLQGLSTAYGNDIYNLGSTTEQKIGSANMSGYNLPSNINTYGASLSGNGDVNSVGSIMSGYTPGTYGTGSLTYDENQAIMARRNQNVDEASRRKASGTSYQDLLA